MATEILPSTTPRQPDLPPALDWSRWSRCESSFNLVLVPHQPGIFALAEEVAGPGTTRANQRILALLEITAADDLARALSRLFAASSPLRERLASNRCFLRYAVVHDVDTRAAACDALRQWMTASTEQATGILSEPPRATANAGSAPEVSPKRPQFPAGF